MSKPDYSKPPYTVPKATASEILQGAGVTDYEKLLGLRVATGPVVLYLSGPMTGLPDFNYPTFRATAKALREKGWVVYDPSEKFGGNQNLRKDQYMTIDRAVVSVCDAVVLLPGWEGSAGVAEELEVAKIHGLPVIPIGEFEL